MFQRSARRCVTCYTFRWTYLVNTVIHVVIICQLDGCACRSYCVLPLCQTIQILIISVLWLVLKYGIILNDIHLKTPSSRKSFDFIVLALLHAGHLSRYTRVTGPCAKPGCLPTLHPALFELLHNSGFNYFTWQILCTSWCDPWPVLVVVIINAIINTTLVLAFVVICLSLNCCQFS